MRYIVILTLWVLGLSVSAQVFSIRETYFPTWPHTGINFINKDSIYFAANNGFGLTSVNNNLKWSKGIFANINCLHLENAVLDFTVNQKNQVIGVLDIRESCSYSMGVIANVDSNENWRIGFDTGYAINSARIFTKDDTTYVYYASYDNPVSRTHLMVIDSAGGIVSKTQDVRIPMFEKDRDSAYVISELNGNYYLGVTPKQSGYFRPCFQLPLVEANVTKIPKMLENNDTIFSLLSRWDGSIRDSGVGYNTLDGSSSKWVFYEKKDRLQYVDFVIKDDFIIIAEHDRITTGVWDVYITVFDKKLNFRHKYNIARSNFSPTSIKVLDDSTLFVSLQNGTLYFLDMDLKQMPLAQLPEDKEADPVNFVEEASLKPQTTLFPNPTTTHFTLQSTQTINYIQVFDLRGALVLEQNVQSTEHQVQLSEAGTYIIHIHLQDGSTERQKVVKMKE
jgi:hypothetical protein